MIVEFIGGALDGDVRDISSPLPMLNMREFNLFHHDFIYNPDPKKSHVRRSYPTAMQGTYQYHYDGHGKYFFSGLRDAMV